MRSLAVTPAVLVILALGLALLALGLALADTRPAPAQTVLPAGDVERGRQVYGRRCSGCHSMVLNRSGPRHLRVFGMPAASAPDYEYSEALRRSGLVWNERSLDRWLADPEALVPGNSMGYSVASARDRADIIAYLRSMSRPRR